MWAVTPLPPWSLPRTDTQDTYNIVVTRAALSSDATLNNLAISSGTLTPAFASGTTSYTDSVANSVSSVTVTPTVNQANATVKVNGTVVTSGSASGAISLNVGSNTITTLVTAQDGTTQDTYNIVVTRAALSSDATLNNLAISSGTLTPAFASGTTSYTDSVANSVSSVTVTPTVNQANATVKVNGTVVTSGSASGAISLNVGSNTITTLVTAQDGTTQNTYSIVVIRATLSSDATLRSLAISSGTLTPAFASGTTSYTDSVANSVSSVTVTPTVNQANATVKVNGTVVTSGSASGAISLNVGNNTINTLVTAQDGVTTKTYTIVVTRAAALSSDATLRSLAISSGTLTPAFASGTTSYTDSVANSVSSVTVKPMVNQANATVKVNGVAVTSGSASGAIRLNVGSNTITTVVTAQDRVTTKTYTITVTRVSTSSTTLNLQVGASGDDGYTYGTSYFNSNQADVTAGSSTTSFGAAGNINGWVRFTGVSGLAGTTITSATLTVTCDQTNASVDLNVYGAESPSPTSPTTYGSGTGGYGAIPLTTSYVPWNANWGYGQSMTLNIQSIIQELANNYNPTSIELLLKDNGNTGNAFALFDSYDGNPTLCAKLTITYTPTS